MDLIIKMVVSIFLAFSIFWTLLPWGFGVHNFAKTHGKLLTLAARVSWLALLLAHPLFIYLIWFNNSDYWPLVVLIGAHITFYKFFGRDVATG
jgi:hypothetical protein